MKKISLQKLIFLLRMCIIIFTFSMLCLLLFSFTAARLNDDIFKELGISKTDADRKLTESFLSGYLDAYGVRNVKNIALGKRTQITKDLLVYTKQYVNSPAFKNEYDKLRETKKPEENKIKTPEEMRTETIEAYKKSIAETEASLKKSDANMKGIFEQVLAEGKKQLKEAEDPKNKSLVAYAESYIGMVAMYKQANEEELKKWEANYPSNPIYFVKQRLQQFLQETDGIDYDAVLIVKNGKKIFVNPVFESKSKRWKMAFRTGREVVEPARDFINNWLSQIDKQ